MLLGPIAFDALEALMAAAVCSGVKEVELSSLFFFLMIFLENYNFCVSL